MDELQRQPHRRGQPAGLFEPDCRVVSADLYNDLVKLYNCLCEYSENMIKTINTND